MYNSLKDLCKYSDDVLSDISEKSRKNEIKDEVEDEIEEEIDIYLNNINANNLNNINTYLIQYPLRPKYRAYNFTNNLENIYYCKDYNKLKNIKNNQNENEECFLFEYKLLDYIKNDIHESITSIKDHTKRKDINNLISNNVLCDFITNCIGIFQYNEEKKKKEIYMIPLKNIYQFKPIYETFNYEKKNENEIKKEAVEENVNDIHLSKLKTENELNINENEINEEEQCINGKSSFDRSSYINDNDWKKIENFYEPDSSEANEIINMFTNIKNNMHVLNNKENLDKNLYELKFNNDEFIYLNNICNQGNNENTIEITKNDNIKDKRTKDQINIKQSEDDIYANLNMFYFFSLSIDEQILEIIRIKNVLSFNELKKMLKKDVEETMFLDTIQNYCVNILGLWIIKSKYLYKFLKCKEKKKEKEENDKNDSIKNFSFIDYKIVVRDLLIGLLYKQTEPLLLKFVQDKQMKSISNNINTNGTNMDDDDDDDNDNTNVHFIKKINTSNAILIENFEKATNINTNNLLEIITPLCEYKYTGYFFKYNIDEGFLSKHLNICMKYNEKWKNKLIKTAKKIQYYKAKNIIFNDYQIDSRTVEKTIIQILCNTCLPFTHIYDQIKISFKNLHVDLQMINNALNKVAININKMWCLKIEQANEISNCRNAIINLYKLNPNICLSKNEIIKEIEKYLNTDFNLPDIYFRNILKEFCYLKNGKYLFKGNEEFNTE